jgi:hypothetical protein
MIERRLLHAAVFVVAMAVFVAGCSRRSPEHTVSAVVADTLATGLPRSLVPKLASWVEVWRYAIPGFAPDSLRRDGSGPFTYDYAWRGAGHIGHGVRESALIDVLSPDSARSLDFDMYLDFSPDTAGRFVPVGEPDSAPILADFKSDTIWRVSFCGTTCSFDGAYWVDSARFALTGATQTGIQLDGPWQGFLDVYDLRTRHLVRWSTRTVDDSHFGRYQAANDSALGARVEGAGIRGGSDTTASSRLRLASP